MDDAPEWLRAIYASSAMSPFAVRAIAVLGPALVVVAATVWRPPSARRAGAAALATLWNLLVLLALNVVAIDLGWWQFQANAALLLGVPADLMIGWALLWGAIPVLVRLNREIPLAVIVVTLAIFDLITMPLAAPTLVLGPAWLLGESTAVALALVPGLWLARSTIDRRHLAARSSMQVGLFTALSLWFLPVTILGALDQVPPLSFERWQLVVMVQVVVVLSLPAVIAIVEFARVGHGTAFPWDPPDRVVATGPFRYVANPMQVSMSLVMVAAAVIARSWGFAALAFGAIVFSQGVARWHEDQALARRHGEHWVSYARAGRAWVPHWRPINDPRNGAVIYVAVGCDPCSALGGWLRARVAPGLTVAAAEHYPGDPLARITYVDAGGERRGVAALAAGLEHINLAWAMVGWFLLVPGINALAQLVADAVGAGPRSIAIDPLSCATQQAASAPTRSER